MNPMRDVSTGSEQTAKPSAKLRLLHRPRQVKVETDEEGEPIAVHLSGRRTAVESVVESWRIDDEWWRDRPVSRLYQRLVLEDGRVVDVYQDLASGRWWRQAY